MFGLMSRGQGDPQHLAIMLQMQAEEADRQATMQRMRDTIANSRGGVMDNAALATMPQELQGNFNTTVGGNFGRTDRQDASARHLGLMPQKSTQEQFQEFSGMLGDPAAARQHWLANRGFGAGFDLWEPQAEAPPISEAELLANKGGAEENLMRKGYVRTEQGWMPSAGMTQGGMNPITSPHPRNQEGEGRAAYDAMMTRMANDESERRGNVQAQAAERRNMRDMRTNGLLPTMLAQAGEGGFDNPFMPIVLQNAMGGNAGALALQGQNRRGMMANEDKDREFRGGMQDKDIGFKQGALASTQEHEKDMQGGRIGAASDLADKGNDAQLAQIQAQAQAAQAMEWVKRAIEQARGQDPNSYIPSMLEGGAALSDLPSALKILGSVIGRQQQAPAAGPPIAGLGDQAGFAPQPAQTPSPSPIDLARHAGNKPASLDAMLAGIPIDENTNMGDDLLGAIAKQGFTDADIQAWLAGNAQNDNRTNTLRRMLGGQPVVEQPSWGGQFLHDNWVRPFQAGGFLHDAYNSGPTNRYLGY